MSCVCVCWCVCASVWRRVIRRWRGRCLRRSIVHRRCSCVCMRARVCVCVCVYDSEGASRLCLCLCVRGYNTDTNGGTPTPLLFLFLCRHGHSQSRVLAGVFSRWQSYKTCSILLKCRQSHLSLCLTTRAVSVWSSCTSRHRRLKGVSLHF